MNVLNAAASWGDALRIYLMPRVAAMLFLGFSAGLPFLLVFSTLSAWLTEEGLSRTMIGFFSWVGITYSIKVVWAPFVDHLRIPWLSRCLGRRRAWILAAQLGIALGLAAMALTDPTTNLELFALLAVAVAFASATQDIVIDAYRIEAVAKEYQAAMAATYIFGYRLALLAAGAGAFYAAEFIGWENSYLVMAALMLVGIITTLVIAEPETSAARPTLQTAGMAPLQRISQRLVHAVVHPFMDFFRRYRRAALLALLLISIYRISDITMGVMANPFYLDMGYTKIQIADVSKIFGFFMTLLGAALGGILVMRFGIMKILVAGAILVAATNLLFVVLSMTGPNITMLALVISADNLSGGIATTAFIAYMSSLTHAAYTATQYALFSSLMTLPAKFIGGFSGIVVDAHGYANFFTYAAVLGIPAILLAAYLSRRPFKQTGAALA